MTTTMITTMVMMMLDDVAHDGDDPLSNTIVKLLIMTTMTMQTIMMYVDVAHEGDDHGDEDYNAYDGRLVGRQ